MRQSFVRSTPRIAPLACSALLALPLLASAQVAPLVTLDDRAVIAENAGPTQVVVKDNDLMAAGLRNAGILTLVDAPLHGTVTGPPTPASAFFTYTPAPDFSGDDIFSYRFCDDAGTTCDEAYVQVVVRPHVDVDATVSVNSGTGNIAFTTLRALPSARFEATALDEAEVFAFANSVDPTPESPWDIPAGVSWDTRTLLAAGPGEAARLRVVIDAPQGLGVNQVMLLGIDDNRDGEPSADEVRCNSGGMDRCEVEIDRPVGESANYWILLHNVSDQARAANLFVYEVPMAPAGDTLAATGPGHPAAGEDFNVLFGWRDDTLQVGDRRLGYITVKSDEGTIVGDVPVEILLQPAGALTRRPVPLVDGETHAFGLAAGEAHRFAFVQVPAGATRLRITSQSSSNIDLYLVPMSDVIDPEDTSIVMSPPASQAEVSATGPTGNETVELTNLTGLTAGRWYVVPVNASGAAARVELTTVVEGVAPIVRVGSYYNPDRSGHGLFLYPAADQWTGLWYTYLPDGTPTWYYLQAAQPGADGLWTSGIYRSAWDGDSNVLVRIGHATVTPIGADRFNFSYRIDGQAGSEPMVEFGRGCPTGTNYDLSSQWFDPARAGTGYSVQFFPAYEFFAAYYYDDRGYSRFVAAELNRFGGTEPTIILQQLQSGCPTCTYVTPVRTDIGELRRRILSGTLQHISTDMQFASPLSGSWLTTDFVQLLGGDGTTQGCDL